MAETTKNDGFMMKRSPKISVVVLLEEQYPDFPDFLHNLDRLFTRRGYPFEIVVVANGTGNFFRSLEGRMHGLNNRLHAFEFGTKVTQAVCLKAIVKEARGETLVICGSYQQLSDESMEQCVEALDEATDVISPWRKKRVDPTFNQLQSSIFNWLVRRLVKTDLHDFSCTVKVCHRSVLEEVELHGSMFRFLPVLAAAKGFKVREVPVRHYQERGKAGFYSFSDYTTRLLDIFTMFFNTRFSRKPLRFFSTIGVGFISIGLLMMAVLFFQRAFFSIPIGNRPFLFVSLLITVLGVLVSSAGLLGEIIAFTNGRHKKEYVIEKQV